jgi:IS605 OrfB family transposase
MVVTTTVTAKFARPTRKRRREWQQAMREYRDVKQRLVNGWEADEFGYSVTTGAIDSSLYGVIQNQAIREAKAQHREDGALRYTSAQPFATNNQNWEIDRTGNGSVVIGFPCISGWWYTPIDVHDAIREPIERLLDGDAKKTRLQVCRRGSDWFCSFSVEYDTDPSGETPIGVDIGERHILAAHAVGPDESMLVSGKRAKYIRRKFRSLRDSLQEAGALRARNRVGHKENRRIRDLNHELSKQLVAFAAQFDDAVLRIERLEGIRDRTEWSGVHSWHFHQLQAFITYKAERKGIRVETVDPAYTSQDCSACGERGNRNNDHFRCTNPECGYERHADLNAAENIATREGEPCTA